MLRLESVAHELDRLFEVEAELPEICREAEVRIAAGIADVVREVAGAEVESAGVGEARFKSQDEVLYEVRTRELAGDSGALVVAIGKAGTKWELDSFERIEVDLSGSGQYTSLTIESHNALKAKLEEIAEGLQDYLRSVFRRVETHVVAALLNVEHRLAVDAYIEVRGGLDEEAASHVGLYCLLKNGHAMYILDPLAIQTVLARLQTKRPTSSASPLALAAILVRGWVKSEDTIAERALAKSGPIGFRLQDLTYTTTPGFDVAEGSLYDGSTLICQPLVRDAPVRLIAAYPVDMRMFVEKKLDELRPRFEQIVAKHAAATKRLVQTTGDSSYWNANRAVELLGRFAGGFTDSLQ